jgi:hypothetical protein
MDKNLQRKRRFVRDDSEVDLEAEVDAPRVIKLDASEAERHLRDVQELSHRRFLEKMLQRRTQDRDPDNNL